MSSKESAAAQIMLDALDCDIEGRPAFVHMACGGDRRLQDRVEALLKAHCEPNSLFDGESALATREFISGEKVGDRIGPYKLRELLGDGGMGVVFVAEQEVPICRKVALKVIKPGMDSCQVLGRFEAERQSLALMDHPNIAKVFDAGTTESGRPYFVMELVRGVPITEFCDARQLDPRQRLELFIQVCRAIQHAHQKGVIHRDVKPSNILVTLHDELPVPKVIDFGIAKATGQRLTVQTVYTAFSQMIGTPRYMSPEQAEMNALDVDTRSDVYSLGVLLYELLTGNTPFDSETLRQAGFDEMRRLIREVDPPRPSQRVSTLDAQTASTVSTCRGVDERRLAGALRGELDWIVMKALEKDRNRRYESAGALAEDISRHLSDVPVQACPPSALYRLKKFSRRYRVAIATAAVLTSAVLAGTSVSVWQAIEATAARRRADANNVIAAKAIDRMLSRVSDDRFVHGDVKHAEALAVDATEFYEQLLAHSQDPDLRFQAAVASINVGKIWALVGQHEKALAANRRALELLKPLIAERP